jgi:transposase
VMELVDDFLDEVRDVAPDRLVFVDEAGSNAAMTPSHGRAPAGVRVVENRGFKRAANISMVGFVRLGHAMQVISQKDAYNGTSFSDWVRLSLVPHLRRGDVVIMDNVRFHKNKAVKAAIRSVGAFLVFQPPYSPEYNPIEEAWSKLKHLLRRAKARTTEELHAAIQRAAAAIAPADLVGWFAHAGYRIPSN